MHGRLAALLIGLILTGPGCAVIKVTVENPIPEMNTIAVTPFVNLTQEPPEVVDGRRFALAYFAELQKTHGFQVIPVGVVEVAILKNQLDMTKKDDVLQLARILGADAIVVGAVTDYSPYYPQRIGLQVDWYSPIDWSLSDEAIFGGSGGGSGNCELDDRKLRFKLDPDCEHVPRKYAQSTSSNSDPRAEPIARGQSEDPPYLPKLRQPALMESPPTAAANSSAMVPASEDSAQFDPRKPVMSYTRLFDGADSDVINRLRDYLELRGDRRSGGWEAHLHRSEDFIRFTSHLMIVEMLSLHGGIVKTQIVLKWRKYQ